MSQDKHQLSMAAGAIALRGVQLFLSAGRAAAERRAAPPAPRPRPRPHNHKKTIDTLLKATRFHRSELEALHVMYRRLVAAQALAPAGGVAPAATSVEGIDQSTFRDVMHSTLSLVTEEPLLERVWATWERGGGGGGGGAGGGGGGGGEGALVFDAWARGLSVLLRGSADERLRHCFAVYDLNADGLITKDEMFLLFKNSLLKQPGDEDPDEGVRDLVDLALRKLDVDADGAVSLEDYREAVRREPLLLEAFGQCLPSRRYAEAFLRAIVTNK